MLKNKHSILATIMAVLLLATNSHAIDANWLNVCKHYSKKAFRITKRSIHKHALAIGGSLLAVGICAYFAKKHDVSLSYINNNEGYIVSLQNKFPFVGRKRMDFQYLVDHFDGINDGSPSKSTIPLPANSAQNKKRRLSGTLPPNFSLNDFLGDSDNDTSTDYSTIKYTPSNGTIVIPAETMVMHDDANQSDLDIAAIQAFKKKPTPAEIAAAMAQIRKKASAHKKKSRLRKALEIADDD